jgi:HEAT repeat protein
MNEKHDSKCPACGAELPAGGVCPRCAAGLLQASQTEIPGESASGGKPFVPPTIAELSPLFPQLELIELIGQGGMGAVYKARQKELDRVVALKILPPGVGGDAAFAERFTREARALAKLNHPGIVTIHDFGRTNGLFFFLMEYVDGATLRQLLLRGRVAPREALAIVPQICDALQFAHDQGIVHRDIKPENILMDRRGRVKVADFGLAKIVGGSEPPAESGATSPAALTGAGKIMGTPAYMPPEQISAPGEVDHRADIYALGVVFYQMLTGELPGRKIEAPSKRVLVDVRLDEVVLRALEQKPEHRYQQASALKTQVETIAAGLPSSQAAAAGRAAPERSKSLFVFGGGSPGALLRQVIVGGILIIFTGLAAIFLYALVSGIQMRRLEGNEAQREAKAQQDLEENRRERAAQVQAAQLRRSSQPIERPAVSNEPPADQTATAAANSTTNAAPMAGASFTVTAAGGAPLAYQWQFTPNGTPSDTNTALVILASEGAIAPDSRAAAQQFQLRWVARDGEIRVGTESLPGLSSERGTQQYRLLPGVVLDGTAIASASFTTYTPDMKTILVKLRAEEAKEFAEITSNNIGRALAIVWCGRVLSAPMIRSPITGGECQITARMTDAECSLLLNVLNHRGAAPPSSGTNSPDAGAIPQAAPFAPRSLPDWVLEKSLTNWFADLQSQDQQVQKIAQYAMSEVGTNALPEILRILREQEGGTGEARRRHAEAAWALEFVGPDARTAIPALAALLNGGETEPALSGARALAVLAPKFPEAYPILTNGLASPDPSARDAATIGVGDLLDAGLHNLDARLTSPAEAALPILLDGLKDKVDYVRADTAVALYFYAWRQSNAHRDAKRAMIVPPLIALLGDNSSKVRRQAAFALGAYGADAKTALPGLTNLLNDPDEQVRHSARDALEDIKRRQ